MHSQVSQGECCVVRTHENTLTAATTLSLLLSDLIAPPESSTSYSQRIVQYSDHYRLAFTLMNENATTRRFVETWDIHDALAGNPHSLISRESRPTKDIRPEFVFPLLSRLSVLHNFTIESQVQYYAPLAFEPKRFPLGDSEVLGLTQEDLTVFINSAEWTLCLYHFLLSDVNN